MATNGTYSNAVDLAKSLKPLSVLIVGAGIGGLVRWHDPYYSDDIVTECL